MKKYVTNILLSFAVANNVFGVVNEDTLKSNNDTINKRTTAYSIDMPNYISMSPEMAELFRFIEYDGDLSSGVMTTSIPVYEIKCGPLSLPLSLAYEASGRRMSEVTGQIGIGWTLNAGGAIAKSVKGNPDEIESISHTGIQKSTMSEIREKLYGSDYNARKEYHVDLDNIINGYFESEYDVFSYTIPGPLDISLLTGQRQLY